MQCKCMYNDNAVSGAPYRSVGTPLPASWGCKETDALIGRVQGVLEVLKRGVRGRGEIRQIYYETSYLHTVPLV